MEIENIAFALFPIFTVNFFGVNCFNHNLLYHIKKDLQIGISGGVFWWFS